jgi:uncharacterized protein (DUF433 family)
MERGLFFAASDGIACLVVDHARFQCRVGDSRIPVWIIVLMSEAGDGVEEMLVAYPQLTPADCAASFNYARVNRAEIDADITWGYALGERDGPP